MNASIYKEIILFILILTSLISSQDLSATEEAGNEAEIIIPEMPVDFTDESDKNISATPVTAETTIWKNLDPNEQSAITILDEIVQPGKLKVLSWTSGQSFSGRTIRTFCPIKPITFPFKLPDNRHHIPAMRAAIRMHKNNCTGILTKTFTIVNLRPIN